MKSVIKKIIYKLKLKNLLFPIYRYFIINPSMKKRIKDYNLYNKELLLVVDDILSKTGYSYWLNYGTLLGAYRDKQFIASDNDLDIGMFLEYHDEVKNLLIKGGLNLFSIMEFPDFGFVEYRFEYKNTFIDINFYTIDITSNLLITYDGNFIDNIDYSEKYKKHEILVEKVENPYSGFSKYLFLGRFFLIPSNVDDYLTANYGENFLEPIKGNFDYHNVALNLTCYSREESIGYFTRYF
ncbi:MAG: hypothetical protein PARBA_00177 [Parabacteroides sp.]